MLEKLIEKRRSIYALGKETAASENEVVALVKNAVKYCPTAFNSQSGRVVVLFGEEYQKLWDIVENKLRGLVPAEGFAKTKEKIDGFRAGLGTILFFEDEAVVQALQQKFPLYKDNFPLWSLQAGGMLQYIVWTALAEKNIGASLQHYNPLIDEDVAKQWQLPLTWRLLAQMPFGSIVMPAGDKAFEPLDSRVLVYR